MAKLTQAKRLLKLLQDLKDGRASVPSDFLKYTPQGWAVSTRYFKQVMLISECNGRISELRADGYEIETLDEKDEYGFAYHRLGKEPAPRIVGWEDVSIDGVLTKRKIIAV